MPAPGYTYLTLGAARAELSARLEDPTYVYWTVPELNDLIIEAVRTWQALTGTFKQRATFSISPSGGVGGSAFYDLNQKVGFLNFSVTDAQVINMILACLLEPLLTSSWTGTGQYSFGQIVYALQSRINRWLEDTGANVTRQIQMVGTGPSASRIFLPEAVLDVRRAAWVRAVTSSGVNVKDLGATGDGRTDDLAAINQALAQGSATGQSVYFPAGTYLVSKPLNAVGSSLTVYGDGPSSSVLKLGGPGSSLYSALLYFSGGANVTVHDLGLDGQHVQAPGLYLVSVNTANVYNVAIRNFGTPGFSAGNSKALDGLYAAFVQTLTVTNSVITGNERSGIEMIPAANATISGNTISGNGYYAAVAEQDPGGASGPLNIQFLNNIAHNNGSGGFDVETGTGMPAAYGKIHSNDIQDCGNDMWGYGIGAVIGHNAYGEISNNTVHNFNQSGPHFPGYGTAVVATPSGPITLTGNYVSNTGDWGIVVNGTGGAATITGNSTSFCPSGGLLANALSGAIIQYNYSYSNSGPDFQITACSGCTTSPNFSSPPPASAVFTVTAKTSNPVPAAISSPVYSTLWRDDEYAMQAFLTSGALAPTDPPMVWGKFVMPPVGIQVYPPPLNPGQLETLVVTSGPQIGVSPFQVATSPTVLDIPEDFVWGMVFGALSDLFSADGPARDPDRAVYAEERYQESAELYRLNPTLLQTQINGVPIWSGSVFEMDSFLASWQASPGAPRFAGMCDRNLVAFGPTPDGVYSVTVDAVGNIPVPVADGDFLQVDRGALDPLIDYAFHLASYKMQGAEFHSTDKLRKNFYQAAALENSRLTRANFYRKAFELPAKRQQAEVPRI